MSEPGCVWEVAALELAMSLMQTPQRERSRLSVRTRQYCCSSQRLSLLKLCDANPPQVAKPARESSMEPGKLPQWGADSSNVYVQAVDKGLARQREDVARQGCTATESLQGFSNGQAGRWQW